MATFIARQVMKQADKSIELGKEKYMAYFVKTSIYLKWRDEVDAILSADGYGGCIVTV